MYTNRILDLFATRINFDRRILKLLINKVFRENYNIEEINEHLSKNHVFDKIKPKKEFLKKDRVDIIDHFISMTEINTKDMKVIDIGSGEAGITLEIKEKYNLSNIFVLDNKTPLNPEKYTKIYYDEDYNILLEDNSVNVIILFNVIHHIIPRDRKHFFEEIFRILKKGGILIIREHDYEKSNEFITFLNLVHIFWYRVENEEVENMWLITRKALKNKLKSIGFKFLNYYDYQTKNLQKLYYVAFIK